MREYKLISDSIFNIYNMVTVIAVLRQLGYSEEKVHEMMAHAAVPSTRHGDHQVGGFHIITQMSKGLNAFATSRAFDYIAGSAGAEGAVPDDQRPGLRKALVGERLLAVRHGFRVSEPRRRCADCLHGQARAGLQAAHAAGGIPAERICYEPDDLKALELLQFRPGDEICLLHDVEVDQTERIYNRLAELAEAHSKHEEVQA